MSMISVAETMSVCAPTYRAIDIRIAALKNGDHWESAFTAIRLTCESPADVRRHYGVLQRRHGTLETPNFLIAYRVLRFSEWEQLETDLAAGHICVPSLTIQLSAPLDLKSQKHYLRRTNNHDAALRDLAWPVLEIAAGENPLSRINTDLPLRTVGSAGYQAIPQAISAFCEVDTWPNTSYGHNLLLRLPIYAVICGAKAKSTDRGAEVKACRHKRLRDLAVRTMFTDAFLGAPKNRATIKLTKVDSQNSMETMGGTVPLPEECLNGVMELSLTHPLLGELERQSHYVRDLVPAAERNLLLEVLSKFCPPEKHEELLTHPAAQQPGKSDQSTLFEQHVGWLFSLLGFSVIVLGKYETLHSGKVKVGTIDLLAARREEVLLIACTLGPPKKEDYGNLWNLQEILTKVVKTNAVLRPVMVTGTTSPDAYESAGEGLESRSIPILDVERLRTLVKGLSTTTPDELIPLLR